LPTEKRANKIKRLVISKVQRDDSLNFTGKMVFCAPYKRIY
jgi:hypothetical protein